MFRPAWPGQVCSLGYAVGLFIERDLGIQLTPEQQDRLIAYYQLDPVSGRRVVRRAAIRGPKGVGKSPEGAYVGYAELVGPVVFAGWDESGQPIGRPHHDPWIQVAAVSEDQTDNVLVWLFDTLNDRPEVCAERGIDLGRTRIYLVGRPGRLEPVTASAGSREGQRVTFAVLDQTESWFKSNGGVRLADTIRRNVAKVGGWSLELQNAPRLGEGSVAELTAKAAEKRIPGVLFDSREPPNPDSIDLSDPATVRPALEHVYGAASKDRGGWVDLDRIIDEIQDPDTDPADAFGYYLNVSRPSSDWAFDRARWDQLADGKLPAAGELIVAGFDGARFDDSVGIVCADVASGTVWTHAVWERPDRAQDDWEVPEDEVTAAVDDMFSRWDVWRFYADPFLWESTIAAWEAKHRSRDGKPRVAAFWSNQWRQIGLACRAFASAIRAGEVHHLGDDEPLTRHIRNAVRRPVNARDDEGRPLWSITKPAPGRKIDLAMAAVLAWRARNDAIAAGAKRTQVFVPRRIR